MLAMQPLPSVRMDWDRLVISYDDVNIRDFILCTVLNCRAGSEANIIVLPDSGPCGYIYSYIYVCNGCRLGPPGGVKDNKEENRFWY